MKQIEGICWPDDTRPSQVQHALRHIKSIEWAIARCKQRRTAVQAGGNVGLWPRRLAQDFKRVVTFEPDGISWDCLAMNIPSNVIAHRNALGDTHMLCGLSHKSLGSHRIIDGAEEVMTRLDFEKITDLDFLQLDIEGYELRALEGAAETIMRCKPLIQLELRDNMLARYGASSDIVRAWLETLDYFQVSAQAGSDFVFECAH